MPLFSFFFFFFYILSPDEGIADEAAEGKDSVMVVSEHNNDRCRFRGFSTGMHMPGIDGMDRTIRFCSADILLPTPLLMRCLIDGLPWSRLVEAGSFLFFPPCFICLHLHITRLAPEIGIMWELSFGGYSECQVRLLPLTCTSSTWGRFICWPSWSAEHVGGQQQRISSSQLIRCLTFHLPLLTAGVNNATESNRG